MKRKIWVFIAVGIMVAIALFVLALKLTPWFYAINTRVRLSLDAPATTNINICWDKQQIECLPLVPYSSKNNRAAQKNEVADIWLGELPPRPAYSIALQFQSGVEKANFHELVLDSSNVYMSGYGKENGAGVNNLRLGLDEFQPIGIAQPTMGDPGNFTSTNNGFFVHEKEIKPGPVATAWDWSTTLLIWILLFSVYLWIAIPVSMLPDAIRNLGSSNRLTPWPKYSWHIYLACAAAGVVMVLLVANSGVLINPYDPMTYLSLATGGGWFNLSRLPGYPLFLGLSLFLSGYNLDGTIALQAASLVLAVLFCAWTLRKWISPYIVFPFVVFCLFSPAQINFARWILRDGLFASLAILGVTAVIAHFTSRKPFSDRWLLFFVIICGLGFLVRENGILLPFALLPVLTLEIIKRLLSPRTIVERVRSILLFLPRYLLPVIAIAAVYVSFSTYNTLHFGYFQLEEQQTSHAFLFRAIAPANFDARGLLKPVYSIDKEAQEYLGWPLYSSYILHGDQHYVGIEIYTALYPYINVRMNELAVPAAQFNVFHQASLLNQIGKNVDALVPKRAVLSGVLRQYISVLYPMLSFPLNEIDISNAPVYLKTLPVHVTINTEKKSDILESYYNVAQSYWWYIVLFVLALLSSLYILKYQDVVFLAPMTVYMANGAFLLYSHMVDARVLVNIDVLLVLQIALGLSLWLRRISDAPKNGISEP